MVKTWLSERFGLTVPVVSAPMGGASGGRLAAAVSAAGALGMIGFTSGTADDLRREASVAAGSGRAFGVGLLAWTMETGDEQLVDAAADAGAALLSVSYGDYAGHVAHAKSRGLVVATQVGTVDEAREAVAAGVDVVVARGGEGGGHGRDAVATLPLLQAVLDAVDVPVLAAGGIGTARGLAAALAAGAAGAWVGTAFLMCTEADTAPSYREALSGATEVDTLYSRVFDVGRGIPWPPQWGGRAVRTGFADRWHGREDALAAAGERIDGPVAWAGQGVGLLAGDRPATEVVRDLAGAEALLRDIAGRLG